MKTTVLAATVCCSAFAFEGREVIDEDLGGLDVVTAPRSTSLVMQSRRERYAVLRGWSQAATRAEDTLDRIKSDQACDPLRGALTELHQRVIKRKQDFIQNCLALPQTDTECGGELRTVAELNRSLDDLVLASETCLMNQDEALRVSEVGNHWNGQLAGLGLFRSQSQASFFGLTAFAETSQAAGDVSYSGSGRIQSGFFGSEPTINGFALGDVNSRFKAVVVKLGADVRRIQDDIGFGQSLVTDQTIGGRVVVEPLLGAYNPQLSVGVGRRITTESVYDAWIYDSKFQGTLLGVQGLEHVFRWSVSAPVASLPGDGAVLGRVRVLGVGARYQGKMFGGTDLNTEFGLEEHSDQSQFKRLLPSLELKMQSRQFPGLSWGSGLVPGAPQAFVNSFDLKAGGRSSYLSNVAWGWELAVRHSVKWSSVSVELLTRLHEYRDLAQTPTAGLDERYLGVGAEVSSKFLGDFFASGLIEWGRKQVTGDVPADPRLWSGRARSYNELQLKALMGVDF